MRNASMRSCVWMLLTIMPLCACAKKYAAEPISTQVVDADTKEPIEGVVVVAAWVLEGGLEGGNIKGVLTVMETVTDQSGRFHFAGWGPKGKPSYIRWYEDARLKSESPEFFLFKSGYRAGTFLNATNMKKQANDPSVQTSDWNDQTMPLKKFAGTLEEYAKDLAFPLNTQLWDTMRPKCTWTQIPLMIKAIAAQTRTFRAARVNNSTFYDDLVRNESSITNDGCSVKEFLREHGE